MRTIVVGLFFESTFYSNSSLNDIIQLINNQFPNNYLIFDYNIYNDINELNGYLESFVHKYPSDRSKITISNLSIALRYISDYFDSLQLNIPNFSLDATASYITSLKNVYSMAYLDQYSAMSQFLLFNDYQCKQMVVLYDDQNILYKDFIDSYLNFINIQANLLNIPIHYHVLNESYEILPFTQIIILCDNQSLQNVYINDDFFTKIPCHCFITLTDLNDNIMDIFRNIPAFPLIPTNLNYTITSQMVYEAVQNKNNYTYGIYAFYDICFILNYLTTNFLTESVTLSLFISVNAFSCLNILPSWINGLIFNLSNNTFNFGTYNCVFTKNVLFPTLQQNVLYEKNNKGGFKSLPESKSLFKKIGIIPWFATKILYDNCSLYHVFKHKKLYIIRFSCNITNIKDEYYNIEGSYSLSFILNYNQDGYFIVLKKIYDCRNPKINSTMSKSVIQKFLCCP